MDRLERAVRQRLVAAQPSASGGHRRHRAGPSTEEGRELGLFHWDPRAWSRWLGEGSQDLPGDPAGSVGAACDEPARAEPSCAWASKRAVSTVDVLAAFDATPAPGAVFPSRYIVSAAAGPGFEPEAVAALAGDVGWTLPPGEW